jgi:hypothetical protein
MSLNREFLNTTTRSAADATRLYFDPFRRIGPFRPMLGINGSGLSPLGRAVLGSGAVGLLVALLWTQLVTLAAAQNRESELLDELFTQTADKAMTSLPTTIQPLGPRTSDSIRILLPRQGSIVGAQGLLQGTVSGQSQRVWIIVHPLATSSYWVQPRVQVSSGGAWTARAYFGRAASIDSGEKFELRAIANPKATLREGQVLVAWPDAGAISDPVVIQRK